METKNFRIECRANGQIAKPQMPICNDWYGVTAETIKNIACGIFIGMHYKYRRPQVVVYEVRESGEEIQIHKFN